MNLDFGDSQINILLKSKDSLSLSLSLSTFFVSLANLQK